MQQNCKFTVGKLNFSKLIPYLMDKRGAPDRPCIKLTRGQMRLEEWKRSYDVMFSSQEGSTACHLANGGNLAGLTSGDTGLLLLTFGERPAGASNIANYHSGNVLTYKNLIYLLNLQGCLTT